MTPRATMVEESVEHAFEDLAARRWIEAALRARETLAATRKSLVELPRKNWTQALPAELKRPPAGWKPRLATENPETQSGDTRTNCKQPTPPWMNRPDHWRRLLMDQPMEAMLLRERGLLK